MGYFSSMDLRYFSGDTFLISSRRLLLSLATLVALLCLLLISTALLSFEFPLQIEKLQPAPAMVLMVHATAKSSASIVKRQLREPRIPVEVTRRQRDMRINSNFLLSYAIDRLCRDKHLLVDAGKVPPYLRKFHHTHNIYRLSQVQRDKLWESVTLEARSDACPPRLVGLRPIQSTRRGLVPRRWIANT